jgi:hypothetical protein
MSVKGGQRLSFVFEWKKKGPIGKIGYPSSGLLSSSKIRIEGV